MTWMDDMIFLVTNTSRVHSYNKSSHEMKQIDDLDAVGSVSIDWIGNKLYWSNPKQQLVNLYC